MKRLLIITQKVDRNDPVLGFFHHWIEVFAPYFSSIIVICLEAGDYQLPSNVSVLSLGKESHRSRLRYVFNFYRFIWNQLMHYDVVFVHMTPIYILLGAPLWSLARKKIALWYNHASGGFLPTVAATLAHRIFCTSPLAFMTQFSKTRIMPVGIDTNFFNLDRTVRPAPNTILFLGRMAPIKKPELLIEALALLRDQHINFAASFYGDPSPKHHDYYLSLKQLVHARGLDRLITFYPAVTNNVTRDIYRRHAICVNLSSDGLYDKTMFEAMATSTILVSSNASLRPCIGSRYIFEQNNASSLARVLINLMNMKAEDRVSAGSTLRAFVVATHDLFLLAHELQNEIENL